MNSVASNSPIVREMILSIISMGELNNVRERHRINNDIVPHVSRKTQLIESGFQESIIKPITNSHLAHIKKTPEKISVTKTHQSSDITEPTQILGGFGRLINLINDPLVSTIEYTGERLPIRINLNGRLQNTRIFLSGEEVKSILDYVSKKTKIPFENQIFKVMIDNVLFNAIVSSKMGVRFLIRKNFQISHDYREAF